MFARKVAARLKPNSLTEFTDLMECDILPWLRKQKGFLDLVILVVPDGREVTAISFWENRGNAQQYHSSGYPEVLKALEKLLDGTPYVKTFDVVSFSLQEAHGPEPIVSNNSVEEAGSPQPDHPEYETHP